MPSTPYYGPDESATQIFLERTSLAGDFLSGVGYGVQLVLYTTCAIYLWNVPRSRGNQSIFLLAYMSILFCVKTIFQAVQARTVQAMFIDNRNYPGGPWSYFLATQNLPINVMFYATLFISTFLADLLILWRCWVIWSVSGKMIAYAVVAFPTLSFMTSFVMGTLWTLQSVRPGLSLYSRVPMAYGTSYYIISLSMNILLTILITIRLLLYRRRIIATLPREHGRHYFSLATIMVESAAFYSVFALGFIISYALNNPVTQIFLGVAPSAQQIASYLIIYRLAQGCAWTQDTVGNQDRLQMLCFSGESTTDQVKTTLETPTDATSGSLFSKDLTKSNSNYGV